MHRPQPAIAARRTGLRPATSLIAALALGLTAAACRSGGAATTPPPPGWQRLTNEAFSFVAPADVRATPVQGIDSYVGQYDSPSLTMSFDVGQYASDSLGGHRGAPTLGDFDREQIELDGRPATIGAWRDDRADELNHGALTGCGVYVPEPAEERLQVTIYTRAPQRDTCLAILRSIRFVRRHR